MPMTLTPPPPAAADLFVRAYRAGLPWSLVLEEARVHRATWSRIEQRGTFNSSTIDRVQEALDRLLGPTDPPPAVATETEMAHDGA